MRFDRDDEGEAAYLESEGARAQAENEAYEAEMAAQTKGWRIASELMSLNMLDVPIHVAAPIIDRLLENEVRDD